MKRLKKRELEKKAALEEREKQLEEEKKQIEINRLKKLSEMLVTSGYSFEGYRIVKYSGYISGDDATLIQKHVARLNNSSSGTVTGLVTAVANNERAKNDRKNFENFAQNTTDAFVKIRRQALKELKEAAYDLDCNTVVGVDFDYVTLDTEFNGIAYSLVCVTANGTACIIKPVDDGFENFNKVFSVENVKNATGQNLDV